MTTFTDAFAQQFGEYHQAPAKVKKARTPVLVVLGVALATVAGVLFRWLGKARRPIMYLAGFGFIDYALWAWQPLVGYAAIGLTLLLLEMLTGGDD